MANDNGLAVGVELRGLAAHVAHGHELWARYFGRLHLGKIRGVLMTINVAMSSMGPLLIGVSRDLLGNHDLILAVLALMPVPITVLALFATRPVKGGSGNAPTD